MSMRVSDLDAVIENNMSALAQPGVLSVRSGYKVTDGWLTDRRSIVVTVSRKVRTPPAGQLLPAELDGVPVDVRQASPRKRLEIQDPHAYSAQLRLSPDVGSVPHFADERTPAGDYPATAASAHARLAAAVSKPELPYTPAPIPLEPVQVTATIQLSASPDNGWPTLKGFLDQTQTSLTVGLYDFTSQHVLDAVESAVAGKQFTLVLDHPPTNPTADLTDPTTVADLRTALGENFDQAWALTRTDKDATAWIYPTAYHIKVAVRDSAAVWVSSGNWNNSNQPAIDPVNNPADADTARHADRDWHVIIDAPELAGVFEAYLRNDSAIAQAHNAAADVPGAPLTPPPLGSKVTRQFAQFFPSVTITDTVTVAPLLTPDPGVYSNAVNTLIGSATESLYMQFQYIELPKQTDATSQPFVNLVQAVIDRQNAGVDVKIIMSEYETTGYLEQLQALGLNVVTNVKIQNNVHNKGIVVDGTTVLVSSQNWSTDGTLYNRDAGVILHNAQAAQYFQQIFLHDWQYLATTKALPD